MDVRDLSRTDLGLLAAATGASRKLLVSMVVAAIVNERGLHLYVERAGPAYTLVMIETDGDVVVGERRLPVAWAEIDEVVRLFVVRLRLEGLLAGHRRWRRRMAPRLAALGVTTVPAND